jgi:molybdopterin synthase sulfur carrier subunit
MKQKILLFGQLKEKLKADYLEIESVEDSDILLDKLKDEFPILGDLSFRVAVDKNLISEKVTLSEGSEVALLPPFSGG